MGVMLMWVQSVLEHSDNNLMNARNLGVVLGRACFSLAIT